MKYVIIFTTIFSFFAVSVAAHSPVYVLDNSDVSTFYSGFQQALERSPNHQSSTWVNPRTGLSGATVPLKTLRIASGQICREYLATVQLEGATQQSVGTACRQTDGSWKIIGEDLVKSGAPQLRFVVVRQQLQQANCAHGNHAPANNQSKSHPQQTDRRFHSPQFHESKQQLQQKAPQQVPHQQQPASKLIKLVGY